MATNGETPRRAGVRTATALWAPAQEQPRLLNCLSELRSVRRPPGHAPRDAPVRPLACWEPQPAREDLAAEPQPSRGSMPGSRMRTITLPRGSGRAVITVLHPNGLPTCSSTAVRASILTRALQGVG